MSEPPAGMYNARVSFGERVVSIPGLVGSVAAGIVLAIALSAPGRADQPDISAQRLLSSWRDGDPGMRMVPHAVAPQINPTEAVCSLIVVMLMMVATHPFGASSRPILAFVRAIPMPIKARCRRSAWFDAVTRLRVGRERREAQSRADADRYCPDHGSSPTRELVHNGAQFPRADVREQ